MEDYSYHDLRDEQRTVRFFDLLPGRFEDEILIHIYQMTLADAFPTTIQDHQQRTGPSLAEISKTVGPEWEVHENLEGQFLFKHRVTHVTSWIHPEAHVYRESYTRRNSQVPVYEAISYTWGSAEQLETINVDTYEQGVKRNRPLLIPTNLAMLLRYLRHTDRHRTLWADSISINQYNIPERNSHVKRMAEVYGFAQRVIVWLGPPSDTSGLAMASLDQYASRYEYTTEWQRFASPHVSESQERPFNAYTWRAILDLLKRPYFDRLWIMQEIQLANSHSIVQCGTDTIDWPRFRRAVLCLRDTPEVTHKPLFDRLINIQRVVAPVRKVDFLRLLSRAQQQKCSDQRDKIYGVVALAGRQTRDLIQPDYNKSVEGVFRDAFEAIVRQTQRLEVLSYCIAKDDGLLDLPSWVPDWTFFSRVPLGHLVTYGTANLTAGHTRAYVEFEGETTVKVAAIRGAKVAKVHPEMPMNAEECFEAFKQWRPSKEDYPTGESAIDAFVLTLIQAFTSERFARDPVLPGHVIPLRAQTQAVVDFMNQETMPTVLHEDIKEVLLKTHERSFFETDSGHFGLTTGRAQPGDYTCTILGCDHLMILRPSKSPSQNPYRVIGATYVHGLWDGEPVLGPIPEPWRMKLVKDKTGIELPYFFAGESKEGTPEDPRLGPLPEGWKRVVRDRDMEDSLTWEEFVREETGEVVKFDPRVDIEILKARGVEVEMLELV